MENKCIMDCHNCTLQEVIENKALCASLLMPAMINRLFSQLHKLENAIGSIKLPEADEIKLNEVKLNVEQLNTKENENIENEDLQRTGKS